MRDAEARLEDGLGRVARAAKHRLADVEAWPVASAFHALRRRVKDLLFEMELLEDLRPRARRRARRRLETLEDILGREHDLSGLLDCLDRASASLASGDLNLLTPRLESMRTALRRDALRRARRLVRHEKRIVRAVLGKHPRFCR